MTLKTLSGPSVAAALADARRLFGPGVVLLESVPPVGGDPARVTVAFDGPLPATAPTPAMGVPPAYPEAAPSAPRRPYGYGAARNVSPPAVEPTSAAPGTLSALVAAVCPPPSTASAPSAAAPGASAPPTFPPATASAALAAAARPAAALDELAAMRARIAELEKALSHQSAADAAARPTLVLVGPAGAGKTSLALRLASRPDRLGAASVGVIVVPPEHVHVDPTPAFWAAGVPAVRVETAGDVEDARATLAGADVLLVDTASLPLSASAAAPVVRRLAALLAPLAPLDVVFVVDAPRSGDALSADQIRSLGLLPDGLAVTRLDESDAPAAAWAEHLELPLRFTSSGPAADHLSEAPPARTSAPAADVAPPAVPVVPAFSPVTLDAVAA